MSPSFAMAYTTRGIGNMEPNIDTVSPESAPMATMN